MNSLINTKQFNGNQQIKTAFATNSIIFIIIHWKVSINLFITSQKVCTLQFFSNNPYISYILSGMAVEVKISVTKVEVPDTVEVGGSATLKCAWDLKDETLYSVKWYQGLKEIYRYTPVKTNNTVQVFPNDFVQVDVSIDSSISRLRVILK